MITTVVHVHDMPPADAPVAGDYIYVGRATRRAADPRAHVQSPWANPYPVQHDARKACVLFEHAVDSPVLTRRQRNLVRSQLRGRILVCWCAKPGQTLTAADPIVCHGQVLARIADSDYEQE